MDNLIKTIQSNFDDNDHFNDNDKSLILNCILESYIAGMDDLKEIDDKEGNEKKAVSIICKKKEALDKDC